MSCVARPRPGRLVDGYGSSDVNMQTWVRFTLAAVLLNSGMAMGNQLVDGDRRFLDRVAEQGYAEQTASRAALNKATDQRVRAFALRLMEDQVRRSAELQTLSASKDHRTPGEASLVQKGQGILIVNLSEQHFDLRYMHQIGVVGHEASVRLFEEASRSAHDPEVKAFAARHLPTLQQQLQTARRLKAAVDLKIGARPGP